MLADPTAGEGDWLVALEQTAGKGRQGREWVSQDGNFFGSTVVDLGSNDPSAPSLSLVAGLALIDSVNTAVPGRALMLKWPNDLLLSGGKLAGILLERSGDRIVVGFGINLASAPEVPGRRTASLGGVITPPAFAPLLAGGFARMLGAWRSAEPVALAQAWLDRAHPIGTRLVVHSGTGETISGNFDGIDSDGALRLRLEDGAVEIIRAGDVSLA